MIRIHCPNEVRRLSLPACRKSNRRGSVLVLMAVSLVLMSAATLALIRTALMQRDIARRSHLQSQVGWLMHSAVGLASSKATADAGYNGEVWTIAADELGQADAARVNISIERTADDASTKQLTITVNYPAQGPHRARRTATFLLEP